MQRSIAYQWHRHRHRRRVGQWLVLYSPLHAYINRIMWGEWRTVYALGRSCDARGEINSKITLRGAHQHISLHFLCDLITPSSTINKIIFVSRSCLNCFFGAWRHNRSRNAILDRAIVMQACTWQDTSNARVDDVLFGFNWLVSYTYQCPVICNVVLYIIDQVIRKLCCKLLCVVVRL